MQQFDGSERRQAPRLVLHTFCPSEFAYRGQKYRALMMEISSNGARMRLDEYTDFCPLDAGIQLSFEVHTPYGVGMCSGTVIWLNHQHEHLTFGVQFSRLSDDPNDPLVALMDSTF